jgi:recombinational DNA repair protein RecT
MMNWPLDGLDTENLIARFDMMREKASEKNPDFPFVVSNSNRKMVLYTKEEVEAFRQGFVMSRLMIFQDFLDGPPGSKKTTNMN